MLESFIESPEHHRQSVRVPALRGAPFIDYDGDVGDIQAFRNRTLEICATQLRYADAINGLFQVVHANAKGAGLAQIYSKLDESLRYQVEISYDVSKQPSVRFIEMLFYESDAYNPSFQTCIVEPISDLPRTFALSTPQLARRPKAVELRLPFAHALWDDLYKGIPIDTDFAKLVGSYVQDPDRDVQLLRDFLTVVEPDTNYDAPQDDTVRVRYFGHACVLMECNQISILIDPVISYPGESALDHFTFDDLPPHIDYVLLTHPHQDHVVMETLLRLRHKIGRIVVGRANGGSLQDISLKLFFQHCGFRDVVELGEYEEIKFEGGRIIGAPFYGEHADFDIRAKLVYGIEMKHASCLFFADSNPPTPEFYAPLRKMMAAVDCLFLGMECVGAPATWLYGPFMQKMLTRGEDQSRRLDGCNADAALALQKYFMPRRLFVYAMGAEPWISHLTSISYSEDLIQFKEVRSFEATVKAEGHHAELLFGKLEVLL
jgi:L-ascorbate metabolism protein UlaG (beta-lactamase superfamily)